jgi:thymidylate synthase
VLSLRGFSDHVPHPLVEFYPTRDLLLKAVSESPCRDVFICGGQQIYEEFIDVCDYVDLTEVIQEPGPADTFFHDHLLIGDFELVPKPDFPLLFSKDGGVAFRHVLYRRRHPERVYLDIAERILEAGRLKGDRTGTGTISVFGPQMEFDLREGFPLLTTKRVFWHGVLEELFWFISGSTDSKKLSEKGIRIWDGNTSREFLDKRGLETYVEGDIGPGYGFQWKHWGAKYSGCGQNYGDDGVDQLSEVVRQIREDPSSRRMIVSAWNVSDLDRMALPPCHLLFQFNVDDQFLDLKMYQRSGDWFLGVPFNIASYGILLTLVAHLTGKVARKLVMTYGDAHIYSNHREQMREQLLRKPLRMPQVRVMGRNQKTLEDYVPGDILLYEYNPHPPIKAPMAV